MRSDLIVCYTEVSLPQDKFRWTGLSRLLLQEEMKTVNWIPLEEGTDWRERL